ncbi:MAG: tRNA epoxyqueuosine(34) reductase QueG [Myxococcales bacterium]|nr:tRNA epoxyqueuosine(34) reductase QueG [Myxococcales bacterium]
MITEGTERVEARIRARASALGFARVGVARVQDISEDFSRYQTFIADGMHGSMAYLAHNQESRRTLDTTAVLEGARSVIVCATDYRPAERSATDRAAVEAGAAGLRGGRIASYARGQDYHNFLRKRLRRLAEFVRSETGCEARPMVDTAPILERVWARLAGVGFVGKNGLIIAPGLGSFALLGEVVTTAELAPDSPLESRCGSCTLCLDACPTEAFPKPFVLDARRCVSFLTIEHEGPIPEELRAPMGDRFYGCDDCQDVCPFNKSPVPREVSPQFALGTRWSTRTVESILALDDAEFRRLTVGSPLGRPGRDGLVRNALIVLGNTGDARHIPALRATLARESNASLLALAQWAIARIEARSTEGQQRSPSAASDGVPSGAHER